MGKKSRLATTDGNIAEADATATLEDLCLTCRVEASWIRELVEHGAIETAREPGGMVIFSAATVLRVQKAKRLARDFDLNTSGVALALDLLDEIERLRARVRAMSPAARIADADWDG